MAQHFPQASPEDLRMLGAPVSIDVAPNLLKPSQWVLRRLETPVSVDAAPTFFLGLTTGPDKAGVFCPHGRILIFPQVYTGGHEEVSVLLCPCGPKSS